MSDSVLDAGPIKEDNDPTEPAKTEPAKEDPPKTEVFPDGDWRRDLGDQRLQKFKTAKDLAKAYFELETWKGTQGKVTKLSKDATKEERAKYAREVLQLPELDKYEVKIEAKTDEQKELVSKLKKVAYENGILPAQLEALLEVQGKEAEVLQHTKQKAHEKATDEALQALKKEKGTNWDSTIKSAQSATRAFIDKSMNEEFKRMGLDKNPHFINLLSKVGEELKEDSAILNGETAANVGMTTEEYNIQVQEIMADPDYFNPQSPRQGILVKKANKIFEKMANLKEKK